MARGSACSLGPPAFWKLLSSPSCSAVAASHGFTAYRVSCLSSSVGGPSALCHQDLPAPHPSVCQVYHPVPTVPARHASHASSFGPAIMPWAPTHTPTGGLPQEPAGMEVLQTAALPPWPVCVQLQAEAQGSPAFVARGLLPSQGATI